MQHASENESRGLRGNMFSSVPYPIEQIKFDFTELLEKKILSTALLSNPDIGPQSRPKARAARIK